MMAATKVCGLDKKFRALAQMFRRFKFPSTQLDSSSIGSQYKNAVSTLYGLDQMKLDGLATELLQEWQLDIEMDNNPQSPETYLMKFTKRVEAAVDEANEAFEEAFDFTSSEETLTQMMEEELFGIDFNCDGLTVTLEHGLAPVASGSTLVEEDTIVSRCSNGSSTTSPIDSPLTQLSQQCTSLIAVLIKFSICRQNEGKSRTK
jgi:hypothetical protein